MLGELALEVGQHRCDSTHQESRFYAVLLGSLPSTNHRTLHLFDPDHPVGVLRRLHREATDTAVQIDQGKTLLQR